MLAVAIIISVLLIIAILRIGVIIVYNTDGMNLKLKIGFLVFKINTDKKNKKRKDKNTLDALKPGSFDEFMQMLKALKETLGRLRRKLLIKKLILHITFAGEDPSKTALQYGSAYAVFGVIMPILERYFRIKHRDLRAYADFDTTEQKIYAKLAISIAVWEIIYVASAILPMFKPTDRTDGIANKRKDGREDGQGTNKQFT